MKLAFVNLVFVPEGEFEPIVNSHFGVDGMEIITNHLWGNTEVLGDFAILQSLGYHFDDPELTRVRLLKGGLRYQQMPKLALQLLQCDRIRHFGEASEQSANAFLFFLVWAQGKETTRGEYSSF